MKFIDFTEVDKIEFTEFSKQFVIETLSETLQTIISESGVTPTTLRSECKDFEDAYNVGQIHMLISMMGAFVFAFESEEEKEELGELKKKLELEIAKMQAERETKQ